MSDTAHTSIGPVFGPDRGGGVAVPYLDMHGREICSSVVKIGKERLSGLYGGKGAHYGRRVRERAPAFASPISIVLDYIHSFFARRLVVSCYSS